MAGFEHLAAAHRHPFMRNLTGRHSARVDHAGVDPEAEAHACCADASRQLGEPLRELLDAFLIGAQPLRPVVHAGHRGAARHPGRIVVERVEANSLREGELLVEDLLAVGVGEPHAIGCQRRAGHRLRQHVPLEVAEGLIADLVRASLGKGEEGEGSLDRVSGDRLDGTVRIRCTPVDWRVGAGADADPGRGGLDVEAEPEDSCAQVAAHQQRLACLSILDHDPAVRLVRVARRTGCGEAVPALRCGGPEDQPAGRIGQRDGDRGDCADRRHRTARILQTGRAFDRRMARKAPQRLNQERTAVVEIAQVQLDRAAFEIDRIGVGEAKTDAFGRSKAALAVAANPRSGGGFRMGPFARCPRAGAGGSRERRYRRPTRVRAPKLQTQPVVADDPAASRRPHPCRLTHSATPVRQ